MGIEQETFASLKEIDMGHCEWVFASSGVYPDVKMKPEQEAGAAVAKGRQGV